MSTQIITVTMDDSLAHVKRIFDQFHFHHVLVVEDGMLFGILSDRDLLKSISPFIGTAAETSKDSDTLKKRVHLVMSRDVISLPADADVAEAVRLFNHRGVSCIPIVDAAKAPVGMLSWRDIMRVVETGTMPEL